LAKGLVIFSKYLGLFLALDVGFHFSVVHLRHGLSLTVVASLGEVGALLDAVLSHDTEVSLLLKFLSVTADFLLLCNHSNIFGSIEASVSNLCLERKMSDLGQVEVVHFNEHI
jgi:hypothetical protein